MGTDTVSGIMAAMEYHDAEVCGFSIPAMEHSTVTSWSVATWTERLTTKQRSRKAVNVPSNLLGKLP
jgi:hypothetical protein